MLNRWNWSTRHWSGKHKQVVSGINLITLMWTDDDSQIPCDYRLYNHQDDNFTKNDHFQSLIATAHQRGFRPECVVFDSWYSSLKNLKTLEVYHRGIKQLVGVERCFARRFRSRSNRGKAIAQRNHIGLALRAFLRLERHCFSNGISWFEAKTDIIRDAVRAYLAKPIYTLNPTA